jgi:hypothetical protein
MLLVSVAFAQTSNVILFTENGEKFTAILNGVRQNDKPETNVKITGLNAEFYKLKALFENSVLGEKNFNLVLQMGEETAYSIRKNNKGEFVLRFVSSVPIAQAPAPSSGQSVMVYHANPAAQSSAVINQQTTSTTTSTTTTAGESNNSQNVNVGVNVDGHSVGVNMNVSGRDVNPVSSSHTAVTESQTTTTTAQSNPNTQVVYLPGYNGAIGCPVPMAANDFSDLKKTIASKTFEDTKMTIAKQVVGQQCLFTSQVKEILQLFTFEESKLDFAKYAWTYTYDRGNYFKVNDVFTFETSTEELNAYIQSQR